MDPVEIGGWFQHRGADSCQEEKPVLCSRKSMKMRSVRDMGGRDLNSLNQK